MPHLDAGALTQDPEGLAFLADVLCASDRHASPSWTRVSARDTRFVSAVACGLDADERREPASWRDLIPA